MNEIDYEALGLVAEYNEPTGDGTTVRRAEFVEQARAVVAALREQGLVVVRVEDCNRVYQAVGSGIFLMEPERDSLHRLRDAAKDTTT